MPVLNPWIRCPVRILSACLAPFMSTGRERASGDARRNIHQPTPEKSQKLSAANRSKNKNRAAVWARRSQSIEKAYALAIPENVHVHTHIALLVDYAIKHAG
jgi:hypothetical protein